MKKIFAFFLAAVMLMSITACGNDTTQGTTDPTQGSAAPTQGTTVPTQETTIPTQIVTAPTEVVTDPTDSPTDPTEGATDPTQNTTAPTQTTADPTQSTIAPTQPTQGATLMTDAPTAPVTTPTTVPVQQPTYAPTQAPTYAPTQAPTQRPTNVPAQKPTPAPTEAPTQRPTNAPTQRPTATPTQKPIQVPTAGHTHSYTAAVTPATCTEGGYTTNTCACGHSYISGQTAAKGHGVTRTETKEATTSAAGYTRVICTVCNGVISETTIPKLEDTHNCADHMQRINCKNLKDGAVGIHTDKYRQYTSVTILACSKCGYADTSSMKFAYSSAEATAMIVEMINQLRYEVYGTHAYDVAVATHHSAAEWSAEYISNDYQHCVPFPNNIGHENPSGNIVQKLFNSWKNSPGHYSLLIDKYREYCSLGVYVGDDGSVYACLIICDKDELYLDNPNYTWQFR